MSLDGFFYLNAQLPMNLSVIWCIFHLIFPPSLTSVIHAFYLPQLPTYLSTHPPIYSSNTLYNSGTKVNQILAKKKKKHGQAGMLARWRPKEKKNYYWKNEICLLEEIIFYFL
jgi:hypothetical protein